MPREVKEELSNLESTAKRIKAYLKQFGGDAVPISKESIFQRMDSIVPKWKEVEQTLLIPVISDPKYEGPLGLPGVSKGTEKGHLDHVRGFASEIKVLDIYKSYSESESLGLKIFHDVPVEKVKLEALCDVFQTEMPQIEPSELSKFKNKELQAEIDVLTFDSNAICLTEVKANFKESGPAGNQVTISPTFYAQLLRQ